MNSRLGRIEALLEQLITGQQQTAARLQSVEVRLQKVEDRLQKVEEAQAVFTSRLDIMKMAVDQLDEKVTDAIKWLKYHEDRLNEQHRDIWKKSG